MVDVHDDAIELVPSAYDRWRERFAAERDRIERALAARGLGDELVRIEHVGSTAVPDLAAKDVVDVDVVVSDGSVPAVSDAVAAELGGDVARNSERWHPVYRRCDGQRFNVHVFAASSDRWRISVATREVLREREDLRAAYERRKRELAAEHDELTPYSRGKSAIVQRILRAAREDDAITLDFEVPDGE